MARRLTGVMNRFNESLVAIFMKANVRISREYSCNVLYR